MSVKRTVRHWTVIKITRVYVGVSVCPQYPNLSTIASTASYDAEAFEQERFGTAGVESAKLLSTEIYVLDFF